MNIKVLSEHSTSTGRGEDGERVHEVFYLVISNSEGTVFLCDGYDNPCDCLDWLPSEYVYEEVYNSDIIKWLEDYKQEALCKIKSAAEQQRELSEKMAVLWGTLDNLYIAKIK